ncbi:MAX dimerization protein MGA a isoform X4 [Chelmon rostratus]|uniref:MAX dimerization protein MGA a isoform X4 n=1 Tax=Chelmon rostratus TaxID=109905 RepID=UPI001BEAF7D4|nr:MAX dimerization protein MGA a isoform X4 [Chelmon rostratus]
MASTKKQTEMVFHQEGAATPAAAPAGYHPPTCFVVPIPGKASEGGMEQSTRVTSEEADMMGKSSVYPSKEAIGTSGGLPAVKRPTRSNPQSDNLSPDSVCKGISVSLDNNSMWNEFFRCKTEMILTKQGSRMFPYCRFRISGLQPSRKYSLVMDIQPLDNSRYKWTGKSWQVAGKAECHVKSQPFAHPESPSTGQHWMQNPVSFYKLRLTNNITDQEGNTILHSMHRYLPRLHVVQTDKAAKDIRLNGPSVVTFTFPQTEFMAVTAFQNSQFAQLKVDYNPFAKGLKEDGSSLWGLKLKLNSGKDSHKDGGMTLNEQHPVKKSLKSLLANHKPRSSKSVDSKPSVSGDLQKNSTTSKDQSSAKFTDEPSCNSHPAQTLFSDLIREAHVSLQRCNLEQLAINNSTSHRTERTNTKTSALKSIGQESTSVRTPTETSPAKKDETVVTKRKVKEDEDLLNSLNCKGNVGTDCSEVNKVAASAVSQNSSVDSNHQCKAEVQSEEKVKQHKRPLPLPALALFLKQHSTKSKKSKIKLDSPPPAPPSQSMSESLSSAAASACPPSDHAGNATRPSKDHMGDVTKSDSHTSGHACAHLQSDEMVVNGQAVESIDQSSSPSFPDAVATTDPKGPETDDILACIPVAERTGPEVQDGTPVLGNSEQPFCTLGTSQSIISSTLATSFPPPTDTVLPAPNSPQTPTITESSTLPSDSPTMKSDSLLPDPDCSSFGFEPLSPASSPEPLPSLPTSITLQLESTTSGPTPKVVPPEELAHSEDSEACMFKWHTVLPPPESYIDTSFTTFQPTPQTLPLASDTSPLLPSQTPSHSEPQTFDTSTSMPPPDPAPSFQESEQSLPFPAELSPLALQLPLSPTFSSLDGDGLSPTPSIADLVHFFSTNDDLGIGVDFSNTEAVAVPCPAPSTVEVNAHELSQQVQPIPANKPCKRKKKSWLRKLGKTDLDQKLEDSTYSRMQPNLEEVEEQLFISFTSKEALKLHVVDSSEENVPQPQTASEGHLQQAADTPENDKSMDVGGGSLPDSINPNNFPAKLWRLVNNPANKAICWDVRGEVIIIDQELFEGQMLSPSTIPSDNADAFKMTNFSSFVRQLNLYGFRKVDPAVQDDHHPTRDSGKYHRFHSPNFSQNHPELVASLRRLTVDNKAKLQAGLTVNCRPPSRYHQFSGGNDGRDKTMNRETTGSLEEKISAFETNLLRDLKLMRHKQVIHPVLQEVGLKMNLLDPTQAIDLQYLGVRLPIPAPGISLEVLTQELPAAQGVCAAFVSRTGKTTDVTQIKGWREKFTPSEAPSTPAPPKPQAGPSSDLPKKNLSPFCSDMLDEYLENEGKLIDERAASFSQPLVEPVVYELPTRSTSYVRTLDSILKKKTSSSPTSDLISGFIPPSKRPKLTLKTTRKENTKQKGPKHNKPRPEPGALGLAPVLSPADSNLVPKQPGVQIPDSVPPQGGGTFKRRKKLKPKTSSQTLSPLRSLVPPPGVSDDMAPLESDSELAAASDQSDEACGKDRGPPMTRALVRQKDLEDGVVWEGRPRTSITEERATIALTSLFTLMGFVSENPTAPIQLIRRRAPPCLNDFCRLGCVCSSLSHCSRISHCGRPSCMWGCSCLKQKVVLLKNLDGSDSSPSHHANNKKRKRKRRMKMAYILKEADSVSQPAERVQTLWKRDGGDYDPDPIHVPKPASLSRPTERADDHSSCARVRAYRRKKRRQKGSLKGVNSRDARLKPLKPSDPTLKEAKNKPCSPAPGEPVQPAPSNRPSSPPTEPPPKPSKRLIIFAECKWLSDSDRSHVLKRLCERMAWDQLDRPFWIRNYLISPIGQTVEESGTHRCIQYKIHISRPKLEAEKPAASVKPPQHGNQSETEQQQQDHLKQVAREVEPLEDWQREVEEKEAEPFENWQREVEEEEAEPFENWQREVEEEEAEPREDWQREVEEGDIEEAVGSTVHQVHDGRESSREEMKMRSKKEMVGMALPFLTGITPAGFLSAKKKQLGGTDLLVQVNAKLYPLAKIQLGRMGALHPANRLAAYLTGRVGSNRKQQGSSRCSSPTKPPQNKNLGPTPRTSCPVSSTFSGLAANAPPRSQPSATVLIHPPPAVVQAAPVKVNQSAVSAAQPAGETLERAGSQVVTVKVCPRPMGGASQVRVVPGASGSFTPTSAPQVSSSAVPPVNSAPKGSQLLIVQVPGLRGKVPVPGPAPCPLPPGSAGQRMILQPVRTASGVQYYRKPDGNLVQLVPISQLKPVNPNQSVQKGPLFSSVLPAASRQTPVVSVVNQRPPVTSVTTSTASSSSASSSSTSSFSSLSGLQSFSVPTIPSPLCPAPGFLTQKGTCTFKILPANTSKEPIVVTCTNVPPRPPTKVVAPPGSFKLLQPHPPTTPMSLISLKPSAGRGAELGVKTVSVSAVPGGPGGTLVQQKAALPQTTTTTTTIIQTLAGAAHGPPPPPPAPPGSEVTPVPPPYLPANRISPKPETDCDLVDLDIICVDDETELVATETAGRVEPEESASSETDCEGEKKSITSIHRPNHNALEKQRRAKMLRQFEGLRREVGLSEEKTSKIFMLKKAVQVIEELRKTETDLKKKKRRLMKKRAKYLRTIAPTAEDSGQVSSGQVSSGQASSGQASSGQASSRRQRSPEPDSRLSGTGSRPGALMEVKDLLDETDEQTDNSSDEERVVAKTTDVITVTDTEDEEDETVEEDSRLTAARRRLASVLKNVDSDRSSLSVTKLLGAQSVTAAFRAHNSVRNAKNCPESLLLKQVHQEIQTLKRETERLQSLKTSLNQQRDVFVREIAHRSGKSEQSVLRNLQHLLTTDRKNDDLPAAAGGGASQDILITSSNPQQQTQQAPPTPVSAPPAATPVQTPVQQPPLVLQVATPTLAPPGLSHNATVLRDRPRTVPNILSRSRNPGPPSSLSTKTVEDSPSFQTLVPGEVLSLINTALPGKPVLTLSPLMSRPTILQTSPTPGVASVTLNIPSLTNQQIHLTSLPHHPTAANFSSVLRLVQPPPPPQHHPQQQQVPAGQPATLSPPSVVSAGSDLSSDQIKDQGQPPSQTETAPESSSSSPPSAPCPGPSTGSQSQVTVGRSLGPEQQQETREDPVGGNLTSLLNEIVFLNQQAMTSEVPLAGKPSSEAGQCVDGHAHSPWLLQLDSDSDDTVTTEMETTQSGLEPGPANGNSVGSVLVPPPLLQMKVGGAKMVDPASSDGAAGGEGGSGQRREGSVAWRPMPRLVPLGLKGNPPS